MSLFDVIAFDADDTLWHNERLYDRTQAGLTQLLAGYGVSGKTLAERLYRTESRNIELYGYGIKSFALSMIEAAVDLTGGNLSARDVLAILELAKTQLTAPVEVLEQVQDVVSRLAKQFRLMLITKGDLHDQEGKLMRSGLGEFFPEIEVLNDKTLESYSRLFKRRGLSVERLVMVGDSLRSDILPVLELGGYAVYVPYPNSWEHEAAEMPAAETPRFRQLERIGQLPELLEQLETQS